MAVARTQHGFWDNLPQPFWALAPMEDVTDTVFRQIVAEVGRPHVFFTEFANVEAIEHSEIQRLQFTQTERPIVAQIWGRDPTKFFQAAQKIEEMGFDGIDLNFGCPVKKISSQAACSALIGNETIVSEMIQATCEGAKSLPISVKTRIGKKKIETEEWIGFLLTQNLAAISVHGRTVAELSKVPAHWDEIGKAVTLRNSVGSDCKIIGNGDVTSLDQARLLVAQYEVDGVMIGRGIFDNVGVFAERYLSREQKVDLFKKHIELYIHTWGDKKNFQALKKFAKTYVNGFEGASEVRDHLMRAQTVYELLHSLEEFGTLIK